MTLPTALSALSSCLMAKMDANVSGREVPGFHVVRSRSGQGPPPLMQAQRELGRRLAGKAEGAGHA